MENSLISTLVVFYNNFNKNTKIGNKKYRIKLKNIVKRKEVEVMKLREILNKENVENKERNSSRDWKEKNKSYLVHLQKFLDATDKIEDEEVKKHIIAQMLKCDMALTEIAEREMQKIESKKV